VNSNPLSCRHVPQAAVLAVNLLYSCAALAQTEPAPPPAPAASAAPVQLQAVTITAERREENIKNVPVSASTLSGDIIDAMNAGGQDMQMLSGRAPSLGVESSFGRAYPRFYVRGYGNVDFHQNASQPVSLVYDDVVQESPVLKGFPAFDLERIEVLRGPQGSLFGRNTPAGVVKFDSVRPGREFGGYVSLSEATHNTAGAEGALNVPLNTDWAMRVSLLDQHRDDWISNAHTGEADQYGGYNDKAARWQLLYQPSKDFSALANVHARTMSGSASLFRANIIQKGTNDFAPNFDVGSVETDGQNGQRLETYGSNLRLRWNLGPMVLHSITALEKVHVFSRGDIDGGYGAAFAPPSGPGVIPFPVESADGTSGHHQFTQELRVESNRPGPLGWQAGLYYFDENYQVNSYSFNSLAGGAQTSLIKSHQKNTAWAAFGSVKYAVNDRIDLRAGLRYTRDHKDFSTDPNNLPSGGSDIDASRGLSATPTDSKINWDLSALYKLTADTNLYARAATGFRATTIQPAAQFNYQSIAKPETVTSYEAGVKSDLFDKSARLSLGVYQYTVKDQQLSAVGGTDNATVLVNAKKTSGRGVELDFEAYLTDRLLVTLGGSYNFTAIRDSALAVATCGGCTVLNPRGPVAGTALIDGNPLPQAPKWVANLTARYGMPFADGELFAFTDWAYRSNVNFSLYESAEYQGKGLLIGGLRLGYKWGNDRYEASVFGRNITNRVQLVGGLDFNNLTGFVNDYNPRIFGVQFRANF
jgi:iron complex outermembrane receptor protein